MIGICKLCTVEKNLQESHLMPRALYKKSRGVGAKGNQDPYLVTMKGRRRSSEQIKAYVLCRDCEQRFSRNGEDHVMRLVTDQKGHFDLLRRLNDVSPSSTAEGMALYSSADTPSIDREKIAYFAISVFWRASVYTWKFKSGRTVSITLGKKYNEQIRRYLMGESSVPPNAALRVIACTDRESHEQFHMPGQGESGNPIETHPEYSFNARGINFLFSVGKILPLHHRWGSMINNDDQWIITRDCETMRYWKPSPWDD